MWFEIFVLLGIVFVTFVYRKQQYWQNRNVKTPPYWFLFGHMYGLSVSGRPWEYVQKFYKQFKNESYWGMYELAGPRLYLKDPDVIKDIMVRDFDHFVDRRHFPFNRETAELDGMFSEMIFHARGDRWKNLRSLISPTFTSGKIKAMYSLIDEKADELCHHLQQQIQLKKNVEMREPLGKFSLCVIATCAFGLELPIKGERSDFDDYVDLLSKFDAPLIIKIVMMSILPRKVVNSTKMGLVPTEMGYFGEVIKEAVLSRKKDNFRREDFLDLLNDCLEKSMNSEDCKVKMSFRTMVAQSILFLVAGYDTTANTLGFICYLLAKHPEAQTKLREELEMIIDSEGEFNYQNLMDAKYMDAVISESLRIFPQAHVIERNCTKPYRVPKTDLLIQEGMLVQIPVYSLHHDEDLWENPSEFRPERFLDENKHKVPQFGYLPFGAGPRICIGMRFALLEMKIIIAKIIMKMEMTLTPGNEEIKLNHGVFALKATDHGVHIHLKSLQKSS